MRKYAAAFSALAFVLGAGEARADVKLDVTYSTYQLRGLSKKAIHQDLHRVAQKDADGLIEGELRDDWHWNFRFVAAENSCRISSDEIILRLNILLPAWEDQARANSALRSVWDSYFRELKAHEDSHIKIAVDAAEQISKMVHGATAAGSCAALEQTLDLAARQIVDSSEKAQDRFDANDKSISVLE